LRKHEIYPYETNVAIKLRGSQIYAGFDHPGTQPEEVKRTLEIERVFMTSHFGDT